MRDVTESPIAGYFVGRARFPKEKARFVSWLALVAQEQPGNVTRRFALTTPCPREKYIDMYSMYS